MIPLQRADRFLAAALAAWVASSGSAAATPSAVTAGTGRLLSRVSDQAHVGNATWERLRLAEDLQLTNLADQLHFTDASASNKERRQRTFGGELVAMSVAPNPGPMLFSAWESDGVPTEYRVLSWISWTSLGVGTVATVTGLCLSDSDAKSALLITGVSLILVFGVIEMLTWLGPPWNP